MLHFFTKVRNWWLYRIGRRGSALFFFSFLDGIYCWSLLTLPSEVKNTPTFTYINDWAPLEAWAIAWGITSLVCFIGAFRKKDPVAFTAAIPIFLLWGTLYLAGDLAGEIYRGYVAAAIWYAFSLFVLLISGWPDTSGGDKWTQTSSSQLRS